MKPTFERKSTDSSLSSYRKLQSYWHMRARELFNEKHDCKVEPLYQANEIVNLKGLREYHFSLMCPDCNLSGNWEVIEGWEAMEGEPK